MALPSSGTISMSDIAEEKKGSGLPAGGYWQNISLRGLSVDSVTDFSYYNGDSLITADYPGTPNSAAPHGMAEFHGWSSITFDGWPTGSGLNTVPDAQWGEASHFNSSFVQVGCNYGQQQDQTNDRIIHRWSTFTSAAASSFSYGYQDYTGLDSATFQAKADYTTVATSGGTSASFDNPASFSPASGTWSNLSTSSISPQWQWVVTINSGNSGTAIIATQFGQSNIYFYNRATLNSVTYPSTSDGYNGNQYYRSNGFNMELRATRGTTQQPGGGGL